MNPSDPWRAILRSILSYSPFLGLIPKPTKFRPLGISAMVRVKNVVDWIEASILSIKDFADEIVVVDNGSTDGTMAVLKKLSNDRTLNLQLYNYPQVNLAVLSNIALSLTSYQWVIRWDADMVARTEGEFDIKNLRKLILSLDTTRYYIAYLRHVELTGDLEHQPKGRGFRCEDYLHTYSPSLKYVLKADRSKMVLERLKVPRYFKIIDIKGFHSFHINVRPKKELLSQYLWHDWMNERNFADFPRLEDYVNYRIQKDWQGDKESAENSYLQKFCSKLVPYDREKFGNCPSLLEELRKKVSYHVLYQNGKIVGRIE